MHVTHDDVHDATPHPEVFHVRASCDSKVKSSFLLDVAVALAVVVLGRVNDGHLGAVVVGELDVDGHLGDEAVDRRQHIVELVVDKAPMSCDQSFFTFSTRSSTRRQ